MADDIEKICLFAIYLFSSHGLSWGKILNFDEIQFISFSKGLCFWYQF